MILMDYVRYLASNQTNNGVIEKYCYNNDPNICAAEGGIYQWNEMMQYSTTEAPKASARLVGIYQLIQRKDPGNGA